VSSGDLDHPLVSQGRWGSMANLPDSKEEKWTWSKSTLLDH
jgi:hypothetical protein